MSKSKNSIIPSYLSNDSRIELFSNKEAVVEGIKGIVEYSESYIKLASQKGIIELFGSRMEIGALSVGGVVVSGIFERIEFSF